MRPVTVVLALHYQNDILHSDGKVRVGIAHDSDQRQAVIGAARRLFDATRAHRLPLIHVRIAFKADYSDCLDNSEIFRKVRALGAVRDGTWGAEFFDELQPLPSERVVTHTRDNPFFLSSLEQAIAELGAQRLIMAGIATNYVVEHAARHASDLGLDVIVAHDACTTAKAHLHSGSLETLSLLATIRSVKEIVADLEASQ
jgi:nicotinamidase-related amidase